MWIAVDFVISSGTVTVEDCVFWFMRRRRRLTDRLVWQREAERPAQTAFD